MTPPRVLILSASVGAGHLRAAEAVEMALREVRPDARVTNVDVLDLTNAAFRRVYGRAYLDLVNRAPHVLGYFYDLLDQPPRTKLHARDSLRRALQKINLTGFIGFLGSEPRDLVINTHFLPAEIIASLRKRRRLSVPQVTVTTDFETHRLWVNQPCECYFTATEEGARYLHSWGVPASSTRVTGIPIHPRFSQAKDRIQCRRELGIAEKGPVILQLAGGFGVGPIEKIYRSILAIDVPLGILVVAGRNEKAKARLEKISVPSRHHACLFGFSEKMDQLMAAADLVVSKPGGLTTSETLAQGAVMAVVNPIPGQESRNSDFLLENGAAIKVNNIATLPYKVGELLQDLPRLERMKANSRRLGHPRAAYAVVEQSLELVKKNAK
jgi:processive 1,2-diacylglycerol beta-glucosyltransferase